MKTRASWLVARAARVSMSLVASSLVIAGLSPASANPERFPLTDVAKAEPMFVGSLGVDDELFWSGLITDSIGAQQKPESCDSPTTECFEYTMDVVEQGETLRIGLDKATVSEFIDLFVYDPTGKLIKTSSPAWTADLRIANPALGTWTARVMGSIAEDAPFRMRAKLEGPPGESKKDGKITDLLPNMRLTPPFSFTFEAPLSLIGPGIGVGSTQPASCTPSETVTPVVETQSEPDTRCLRFGLGPQNVGDGPLELHYQPGDPSSSVPITQIVYRSDGTTWERVAGTAEYHVQHAHYHHVGFGSLELLRVTDSKKGTLEPAGTGPKQGYCIAQYMIVDWYSFDQDERVKRSTCESRNDSPTEQAEMFIAAGWSDIYDWALDYNYVDFGANPDGLYVVRSTTDPENQVLETDESDNTGYALIDINGNEIEVLERGFGESPWDNHKELADPGMLYMNADTKWVPFNDLI